MPRIFISYRRADSRPHVERIHDRLVTEFGRESIFLDVETGSIPLGSDFRRVIERAVNQCDVILVVIGPKWLDIREDDGPDKRRLDNPDDYVRFEIQTALSRTDALVIPVLVGGVQPDFRKLPPELKDLAYLNAKEIKENPYFHGDMKVIVEQIRADFPETIEPDKFKRSRWMLTALAITLLAIGGVALIANGLNLFGIALQPTSPLESAIQLARIEVESNTAWQPFMKTDGHDVEMMLVPVGNFEMGSDEGIEANEAPVEPQKIETSFWIDRTEVTRAMYTQCVEADTCTQPIANLFSTRDSQPINAVTWSQAKDYCKWRGARLPTEREWEYAARGPDNLKYPWGDDWDEDKAVWSVNANGQTVDVGSKTEGASWVGALDMSGNVWEWTSTIYDQANFPYPYKKNDGRESDGNDDGYRVVRDGSLYEDFDENDLRTANRARWRQNSQDVDIGFRCVRSSSEI